MSFHSENYLERLVEIKSSLANVHDHLLVLIVEDDAGDATMAQMKLQEHGIESRIAMSGEEAIQRILKGFSVVFLDWRLRGKSGLDTLKELKVIKPDCIVVILTGMATDDDASKALAHGAAVVIAKPLTDESINLIFGSPNTPP